MIAQVLFAIMHKESNYLCFLFVNSHFVDINPLTYAYSYLIYKLQCNKVNAWLGLQDKLDMLLSP